MRKYARYGEPCLRDRVHTFARSIEIDGTRERYGDGHLMTLGDQRENGRPMMLRSPKMALRIYPCERMYLFRILIFVAALSVSAQPTRNGELPGPFPLFPSDNWWNVDISAAPVDPASPSFIQFIGQTRGMHPDFGGDSGLTDPLIYGMPYIVVDGDQPLEPVSFFYADESDFAAPGRPPGYPIPVEARTGTRWIEGGRPGSDIDADGDRHMLIVDRDRRILYELYDVDWDETTKWRAGSGAIFPLDTNARRPEGWTSADAAGLAILPGLVRYEEMYGEGEIQHAFRVTVRQTNGHVFPASHTAGSTQGALPMGARLRLKQSVDLSGYPEPIRKSFEAMKRYGLIVADNGSDLYVTGTYDIRWDNDLLNPAFRSITASDFEVIELGWTPPETSCAKPVITMQPAAVAIYRGEAGTLSVAVSGSVPFAYQWYEGEKGDRSTPVDGATQSSVVVSPESTRSYWVRISNECGTSDSDSALVSVSSLRRRGARRG